jgi:23S rRNA G2445 N2-methylase RlmL
VDKGGSIPPSLIVATPCGAEEVRYRKAVRAAGLEPHPAILPAAVARFGIQLATDPGDVVYDPMCGSGTVAVEAMKLGGKQSPQTALTPIWRAQCFAAKRRKLQ